MQCDDKEIHQIPRPCLNEIDNALNELGMLATRTKSRDEYLSEIQNKKYLNMLTINTRYVSNVSIGFRVRPTAPHVRYKPYKMPKERHRTRSENNDSDSATSLLVGGGCSTSNISDLDENSLDDLNKLKKAKSLESIIAESRTASDSVIDFNNIKLSNFTTTMSLNCNPTTSSSNKELVEVVSNSIQKLKVDE